MDYVKINNIKYPAVVNSKMTDSNWDDRPTKSIKLKMSHKEASKLFVDNVSWSFILENIGYDFKYDDSGVAVIDDDGNPVMKEVVIEDEQDCSEYCIAGDIVDHRDGYITVTMGKYTELEDTLVLLLS